MGAMPFRHLYLLCLFTCKLSPEVAAEVQESSDGPSAREPVWLTDVQAAMEFVAAAEVTVIGFFQDLEVPAVSLFHSVVKNFQDVSFGISTASEVLAHYSVTGNTISLFRLVDNKQLDLKSEDIESMDATKLSHFIQRNNLHLVTEYNPMTVIGLFNSMTSIHLLLMMNKASPEHEESLHRYREAAKLFQGKILFILVDSGVKKNGKVISFFKLKKPQLPALAIYQTLDDVWDTLPVTEVSVEHVQNFCDGFLKGKRLVSVRLQVKQVEACFPSWSL
ncbi:endoplasmic reticulum resident protein 27 isoform X1 [Neophocaena asiaeorientalis asiaeorientalis]|uniref:Endoplasmic reticulum resident protein 27 n=1 Tax=Neophocaena asiaeorientalis asiaeorientalis TaxID=1706337 RepID=A0A341ADU1_NEOAA|nr:endoplasmic reticulum resident protein 27 isoform X1 [Neophocaena asiaeorientalis asiaeorientalis]